MENSILEGLPPVFHLSRLSRGLISTTRHNTTQRKNTNHPIPSLQGFDLVLSHMISELLNVVERPAQSESDSNYYNRTLNILPTFLNLKSLTLTSPA